MDPEGFENVTSTGDSLLATLKSILSVPGKNYTVSASRLVFVAMWSGTYRDKPAVVGVFQAYVANWKRVYHELVDYAQTDDNDLTNRMGVVRVFSGNIPKPPVYPGGITFANGDHAAAALTVLSGIALSATLLAEVGLSVMGGIAAAGSSGAWNPIGLAGGSAVALINQLQFTAVTAYIGDYSTIPVQYTHFAKALRWSNFQLPPPGKNRVGLDDTVRDPPVFPQPPGWVPPPLVRRRLLQDGNDGDEVPEDNTEGQEVEVHSIGATGPESVLDVCHLEEMEDMYTGNIFTVFLTVLGALLFRFVLVASLRWKCARNLGKTYGELTEYVTPYALRFPRWELLIGLTQVTGLLQSATYAMHCGSPGWKAAGALLVILFPTAFILGVIFFTLKATLYDAIVHWREVTLPPSWHLPAAEGQSEEAEFEEEEGPPKLTFAMLKSRWQQSEGILAKVEVISLVRVVGEWHNGTEKPDEAKLNVLYTRVHPVISDWASIMHTLFVLDLIKKVGMATSGAAEAPRMSAVMPVLYFLDCLVVGWLRPYSDRLANWSELFVGMTRCAGLVTAQISVDGRTDSGTAGAAFFGLNVLGTIVCLCRLYWDLAVLAIQAYKEIRLPPPLSPDRVEEGQTSPDRDLGTSTVPPVAAPATSRPATIDVSTTQPSRLASSSASPGGRHSTSPLPPLHRPNSGGSASPFAAAARGVTPSGDTSAEPRPTIILDPVRVPPTKLGDTPDPSATSLSAAVPAVAGKKAKALPPTSPPKSSRDSPKRSAEAKPVGSIPSQAAASALNEPRKGPPRTTITIPPASSRL